MIARRNGKQGLVMTQARAMGGGEKKPSMPNAERDFDIVFVGGINSTALAKFVQQMPQADKLKMAVISAQVKYVQPQMYFATTYGHLPELQLMSGTVSSQVDNWSRLDVGARVETYDPSNNKLTLDNGREYSYKALVLAPGLEQEESFVEGLPEMFAAPESEHVFVHKTDTLETCVRNYYHGMYHRTGNLINYSPGGPYKGEGSDFYAFVYEHLNRQDKAVQTSSSTSRIQFITPREKIFEFDYANEVALDECNKRDIDVIFGQEMVKVHYNEIGQKIATFRDVKSGDTYEHDFNHASITPPCRGWNNLADAGITNDDGLIDVNPYTLQHSRFENIFAFGDAIAGNTTRTQNAAHAQNAVVKNNILRFVEGKELNGVYDGYSYYPVWMGHSSVAGFSHTWDYEATSNNHAVPHHGVFGRLYQSYAVKNANRADVAYSSFGKDHGPPYKQFPQTFDELDNNSYLQSKGVDVEALRNVHNPAAPVPAEADE